MHLLHSQRTDGGTGTRQDWSSCPSQNARHRRGRRAKYPPLCATARLLKWPLDVMPNCVICIRLPAVASIPVIGMLEMPACSAVSAPRWDGAAGSAGPRSAGDGDPAGLAQARRRWPGSGGYGRARPGVHRDDRVKGHPRRVRHNGARAMVGLEEHSRSRFGRAGHPWTLGAGTGMKKRGARGRRPTGPRVTVQVGDRGGALLPRSATSPPCEPPA